jgi:hypothetical protein
VLAIVPGPDARVLAAVAGLTAQLALDKDLLALVQVLVAGFRQLAPPLSDSFHPVGQPATRSLDTTWRVATEKLVTGVPSGAYRICGAWPTKPMMVMRWNMVSPPYGFDCGQSVP